MKINLREAIDARILDTLLYHLLRNGIPPQTQQYKVPFRDSLGRTYRKRLVEKTDHYYPVFINHDEAFALDAVPCFFGVACYAHTPPLPREIGCYKMFRFFWEK